MNSTSLRLILDLATIVWVVLVFAILFLVLPYKLSFTSNLRREEHVVSTLAKTILFSSTGIILLAFLGMLNWLTLVAWYGVCLFGQAVLTDRNRIRQVKTYPQRAILAIIDILDQGISLPILSRQIHQQWKKYQNWLNSISQSLRAARSSSTLTICALVAILSFALLLRFEYPLQELRFANPNSYQTLIETQQFLSGKITIPKVSVSTALPILPAIAATVSLIGSIHPLHVVRFLDPLMGLLVVFAVGYCLWQATQKQSAVLIGMYSLGAYLFTWSWKIPTSLPEKWQAWMAVIIDQLNLSLVRQWTGGTLSLGVLFLLLVLAQFPSPYQKQSRSEWVNLLCCSAIVLMAAPPLCGLIFLYALGRLFGGYLAVLTTSLGWLGLGFLAALPNSSVPLEFLQTLPIGLSLLLGIVFTAIVKSGSLLIGNAAETICVVLVVALSLNFALPSAPKLQYVEYEISAQKALELNERFPAKYWMIVAPPEQLPQTLGRAWFEDLAGFVEKYEGQVSQANFRFPVTVPDLFIFVEKRPFITFATEPAVVPDALVLDDLYRNYRSTAGRASLQYRALKLCEDYRSSHSDLSIEFEDSTLRIYHLKQAIQPQES